MIIKTSKDSGHYHLAYVRPDGSVDVMPERNHTHMPVQSAMTPTDQGMTGTPDMPPSGGMPTLAEAEGHTHTLSELPAISEPRDDMTDDERVAHVRKIYEENLDREATSRDEADECEDFAYGEQWTAEQKAILQEANRACVTMSLIEPLLDDLFGKKRGLLTDIKFSPVENGDNPAADIFTAVTEYVCRVNCFSHLESRVFEDQVVAGRGLLHAYIDYSNIQGEIKIEQFNWRDVLFGEHNNIDGSDLENLVKVKWISKDKLKQMWPDKADEIEETFDVSFLDSNSSQAQDQTGLDYGDVGNDYIDTRRKTIRLIELEELKHIRVPVIVNVDDGGTIEAEGWSSKDLATVKKYQGMRVLYRKETRLERTIIAGGVVLDHETIKDEGGFSIIPVYARKVGKKWWGIVKRAMDAQRVFNVAYSKGIDIINSMAAYGYGYDQQTFASKNEQEYFRRESAKPGFMVKLSNVANPPYRFDGSKVPYEVIALMDKAEGMIHATMNIKPDLQTGERTSGLAMIQAEQQAAKGVEFLFSNLENAKVRLGEKLLRLIQKCYANSPQRVVRILMNSAEESTQQQAKAQMEQVQQFVNDIMNKKDIQIDVAVTASPHSPTHVMSNFALLLEMQRAGVPMPPELLIQNSPMSSDMQSQALGLIQQQKAAASAEVQQKYNTEIEKTKIAKSGDTGEMAVQPSPVPMQQ